MSSENGTTSDSPALTPDQEVFVKECEDEFVDRYTDKDPQYKKLKEVGIGNPPIVEPWYSKPRRNFDWSNRDKARDQRREDSHRSKDSDRSGDSSRQFQQNRRDNYHNNKYRSHHDYRSRPY